MTPAPPEHPDDLDHLNHLVRPLVSDDDNAIYDACASVPEGMVITYGDLAQLVGRPTSHALAVAMILGRRPGVDTSLDPLPWWRVVRSDGSMLDPAQVKGPSEQWVNYARGKLVSEGVPMTADGRVDMAAATRMPVPEGVKRAPLTKRQAAAPEPCWKHDRVQYSCRDCTA